MKRKTAAKFILFFLAGFLLAAGASAQSIAYRQHNLASDLVDFADNTDPFLLDPWGIAIDPGASFVVANSVHGRVISLDATGLRTLPPGFSVPNPAGTAPAIPTGIVTNPDSLFRDQNHIPPFLSSSITVTADGGIYFWAVNADGTFLPQATLVVDHSQLGAVYTAVAILKPDCCAPFLAVANFHTGRVEAYSTSFAPLGSFLDPSLPPGYAPFGMQVIGKQLFITSALQDAGKHDPVFGAGNGIVSVFDLESHFLRQLTTAGPLNAPWGIAQANADFGPFSNDILIGNTGDGTINAFDPVTGNFAGQLKDGDGNVLVIGGLHALASGFPEVGDKVGDSNTLYLTAGIGNRQDGLFASITPGLVSTTRVNVPPTAAGTVAQITVTVSAGPGNTGTPKGMVTLQDNGGEITDVALTDGIALFNTLLRGVEIHHIAVQYHGDDTFLPSSSQTDVQVTGPSTTLTLAAPANAVPGAPVTLTATVNSTGGTPTGVVAFQDGNNVIGTALLNAAGIATFTTSNLAAGTHNLSASYGGDGSFAGSVSTPVTITIGAKDFSLGVAPMIATVMAGQSTSFNFTVTPAGGFGDPVTFSCPPITGITCSFNPPIVTPNAGVATTTLTVTTSADVPRFGWTPGAGSVLLLGSLGLIGMLALLKRRTDQPHVAILELATSVLTVITLALTLVSCGGLSASPQTSRGTASVQVTAQSAAIAHTTTINITVQ